MHPVIYLNKSLLEASKASISPVSSAVLQGRGCFATLGIYEGKPFRLDKHWERLEEYCARLSIDHSEVDQPSVNAGLGKLISVNKVVNGRARILMLAGGGSDTWRLNNAVKTNLLMMTAEPQLVSEAGMTLAVSPFRINTTSPLTGIKSLSYLDRVLSWEEAKSRDFDEAVLLNERGEVVSATQANIFWTRDGTIYTPSIGCGAVAGVTREVTIELASNLFIPLIEGVFELSDLADADEIFLTSSSIGVAVVTTFDFRQYSVATGSIAARLREGYRILGVGK